MATSLHGRGIHLVDTASGVDNGLSPFATIQAAVAAASSGDTILIEAGSYEGPVLIDKSDLILRASSSTGPRPVVQVSAPTSLLGTIQIADGVNLITVERLEIIGIDGTPGLEKAAVYLAGDHDGITLANNTITAVGDAAILTEYGAANSNITISGNLIDGTTFTGGATGGPGGGGQLVEPNWPRSLVNMGGGAPSHSGIQFINNTINAVSGDANNSNTMINIDAAGAAISGNSFGGDTGSRPGVPVLRARGTDNILSGNTFSALSHVAVQIGGSAPDSAATSEVSENSFLAAYGYAVINASTSPLDARSNYWGGDGSIEGSGPFPPNSGVAGPALVSPWYADPGRSLLVSGVTEDTTIAAGESLVTPSAFLAPGTTLTVRGNLDVAGPFILGNGAVLDVIGGELVLAGSALSGSFKFFNSFGSVTFNGDTSLSGSADGLILISDVHVADGITISVDGSLIIDGSSVDSPGRFDLIIGEGARFTMARTRLSGADIQVRSGDVRLYDNEFLDSTVLVFPSAVGAAIYHNIPDAVAWLTDAGVDTVTAIDGWGNVLNASESLNNLMLDLDIGSLPYRTRDAEGNIFIQPGDAFAGTIHVSALQARIAGTELLLGYNTEYLTAATLALVPDWDTEILTHSDATGLVGKLDTSLGLSFAFADPTGTDADQQIAGVDFIAVGVEGQTAFFHRVKQASDTFGGEIRLTTGGPAPAYLTPFTSNSGIITIDGTSPVIVTDPAHVAILQDGTDMTLAGNITGTGTLEVAFSAADALAGINDSGAEVLLVGQANPANVLAGVFVSSGPSTLADHTEFLFHLDVLSATPNGLYDVVALVRDLSGNESLATLGVVEIATFQVVATVQLQGLVAAPLNRDVTFVLTDSSGAVLETRVESILFSGGIGSAILADVDPATAQVSAKAAWNLRVRLSLAFDGAGAATADFTGISQLPGGDLNGDNVIGTTDFGILRFFFNQAGSPALQADITGSGFVGTTDFGILRFNFNTIGDPL